MAKGNLTKCYNFCMYTFDPAELSNFHEFINSFLNQTSSMFFCDKVEFQGFLQVYVNLSQFLR